MKNYEKYADEIREYKGVNFCNDFVMPNILKLVSCHGDCAKCRMLQMIWLLDDYEEPEIDWSKVEVDTPILVRDNEDEDWIRRHFAKYENGLVYSWCDGCTRWTAYRSKYVTKWNYAKLAETEDAE